MVFREVLDWHTRYDRMPRRCHRGAHGTADALESDLAKRWRRWSTCARLTPAAQALKTRIQTLSAQSEAAERHDRRAARAELVLRAEQQQWSEENDVNDDDWWRRPALHRSRGGRHPYPSFSNIFNTCYLNAPLQCLLHCPAARSELLKAEVEDELLVQDVGEGGSSLQLCVCWSRDRRLLVPPIG